MKYNFMSTESEVIASIYDLLASNSQFPQFKPENIIDGFVDDREGIIEFTYEIDEIYNDGNRVRIDTKVVNIIIEIDVQERR